MHDIRASLAAALVATALEAVGRFAWGGPYLPELMAEKFFALIPVWAFTPLFRTFGYHSKYYAFGGMIVAEVVSLSLVGIAIRRWMRRRRVSGSSRRWLAPSVAGLLAIVILLGLLPLLGAGIAGSALIGGGTPAAVATVIAVTATYVTVLGCNVQA